MTTVNKVILIGYLGKDPEFKTLTNGNEVGHISVATTQRWKGKETGEKKEKTSWHRVVLYQKGAVEFAKNLKKGAHVYVEGMLDQRNYETDTGEKRSITEVLVQAFNGSLIGLEGKGAGQGETAPAASEEDYGDMPY